MDSSRFDELTKALAIATSRRQALKAIGAALGGALGFSRIGIAFGAPKCHRNGTGCDTNSQCCSGYCANGEKCTCPPAPACNSICPCPSGQVCQSGTCVTPCTPNGGTCNSNSACCSHLCDERASPHTCVSCLPANDVCTTNSDCCSNVCCRGACCATGTNCTGGPCSTNSDCCSNLCLPGGCA
jgi:hypothetical protein